MYSAITSVRREQHRVLHLLGRIGRPLTPQDIARRLNESATVIDPVLRAIDVEATLAALLLRPGLRKLITVTARRASRSERRLRRSTRLAGLGGVVILTACTTAPHAPKAAPEILSYFHCGTAHKLETSAGLPAFGQPYRPAACSESVCLTASADPALFVEKTIVEPGGAIAAYFSDDSDRVFAPRAEAALADESPAGPAPPAPPARTAAFERELERITLDLPPLAEHALTELVAFANNSDRVDRMGQARLEALLDAAKAADSIRLRGRVGYRVLTDDQRRLAVGRAIAVRRALVSLGVEKSRIRILVPRDHDLVDTSNPAAVANRSVSVAMRIATDKFPSLAGPNRSRVVALLHQ